MFKRFLLMAAVLLIAAAPNAFAGVGIFDFTADIGNPEAIGSTQLVWDDFADRYLITAGGGDIWGNSDQFHFAYNEVGSGDIRLSMKPSWQADGDNDWSKNEVMLRDSLAAGSMHYSTATRGGGGNTAPGWIGDSVFTQRRESTGGGSNGPADWWGAIPNKLGVQRVTVGSYQVVQSLVDQGGGAGWEVLNTSFQPGLNGDILAGVAVTSHQNNNAVQAWADDVVYDRNPSLIGNPFVGIGDPLAEVCGDRPGFKVKTVHMPVGWGFWGDRTANYAQAEWLVKNDGMEEYPDEFGPYPGAVGTEIGTRIVELVNLADDGATWDFHADNGFPDERFPGIDEGDNAWTDLADDADGDDQFAVLVEACIELTEGLHIIGGSFDDGLLIRIGGVEIGRNGSWNERSGFLFTAPVTGVYSFEAIGYEIGGGAFLEIVEYLPDGSKILLGDVANGGSAVFVPEPATIALLGFGGLSMLRIRRKR